jgi:hypothetical protein
MKSSLIKHLPKNKNFYHNIPNNTSNIYGLPENTSNIYRLPEYTQHIYELTEPTKNTNQKKFLNKNNIVLDRVYRDLPNSTESLSIENKVNKIISKIISSSNPEKVYPINLEQTLHNQYNLTSNQKRFLTKVELLEELKKNIPTELKEIHAEIDSIIKNIINPRKKIHEILGANSKYGIRTTTNFLDPKFVKHTLRQVNSKLRNSIKLDYENYSKKFINPSFFRKIVEKNKNKIKVIQFSKKFEYKASDDIFLFLTHDIKLNNVYKIDLSDSFVALTDIGLIKIVKSCPNLEELDLTNCQEIKDNGLIAVAESCPKLTNIIINGCTKIKSFSIGTKIKSVSIGIEKLAEYCPNIKIIYNNNILLTNVRLEELIKNSANKIDLTDSLITDIGLEIYRQYNSNCTSIDLKGCVLIKGTGFSIGEKNWPNLNTINLSFCDSFIDDGLKAIANTCPNLTSLNLAYCKLITNIGLTDIFIKCNELNRVNLYGCNLTINLVDILKYCKKLKYIKIQPKSNTFQIMANIQNKYSNIIIE